MTPPLVVENTVEESTLHWLSFLGYTVLHGPVIAAEIPKAKSLQARLDLMR